MIAILVVIISFILGANSSAELAGLKSKPAGTKVKVLEIEQVEQLEHEIQELKEQISKKPKRKKRSDKSNHKK